LTEILLRLLADFKRIPFPLFPQIGLAKLALPANGSSMKNLPFFSDYPVR
jgi:hypothetical protein